MPWIDVARPVEDGLPILLGVGTAWQGEGELFVQIDFARGGRNDVREQSRL